MSGSGDTELFFFFDISVSVSDVLRAGYVACSESLNGCGDSSIGEVGVNPLESFQIRVYFI
jgi:hypothetical protein